MAMGLLVTGKRPHPMFFWFGALAVTVGVGLHLPMYVRSAAMNFHVAGMPVDAQMLMGMALIAGGTTAAWYGLLPATVADRSPVTVAAELTSLSKTPMYNPESRLKRAHWQLLLVLTLAVIIDSMKPASLGFVIPGTAAEYGLSREFVALFPFCALAGLTIRS